ncbi:MAG: TPM domain-containing protein [Chthoniobacterales bacterium]|nr:TPM domain-containing protein [Chthoniobacterales bacterium]
MGQLRDTLRLFHKKFPQTVLSVFVMELPRDSSASEFAFWLANRARFSTVQKALEENFDMLMVIDLAARQASLAVGYGLEPYLEERHLQEALDEFAQHSARGKLAAGLQACVELLMRRLRDLSREAQRTQAQVPQEENAW